MSRRRLSLLVIAMPIAVLALTVCGTAFAQAGYDVVIHGGRVLDPETSLDAVRDVGIRGKQIAAISEQPLGGKRVIEPPAWWSLPGSSISISMTRVLPATA